MGQILSRADSGAGVEDKNSRETLPDHIILLVADQLLLSDSQGTLAQLAATSRHYYNLLTPKLYGTFILNHRSMMFFDDLLYDMAMISMWPRQQPLPNRLELRNFVTAIRRARLIRKLVICGSAISAFGLYNETPSWKLFPSDAKIFSAVRGYLPLASLKQIVYTRDFASKIAIIPVHSTSEHWPSAWSGVGGIRLSAINLLQLVLRLGQPQQLDSYMHLPSWSFDPPIGTCNALSLLRRYDLLRSALANFHYGSPNHRLHLKRCRQDGVSSQSFKLLRLSIPADGRISHLAFLPITGALSAAQHQLGYRIGYLAYDASNYQNFDCALPMETFDTELLRHPYSKGLWILLRKQAQDYGLIHRGCLVPFQEEFASWSDVFAVLQYGLEWLPGSDEAEG